MSDNTLLPPMPAKPDLSMVNSWERHDVARKYYRLRSSALEARLRLAVKSMNYALAQHRCPEVFSPYHNHWSAVVANDLATIGDLPEEKP